MRTTTLGSNGPEVGVIGLGCMGMTFSYDMETPRDEATSIAVIRQALDLGMTLIDTADVYGPHTNEELVGRALAGGHRDQAVLATKVGISSDSSRPGPAEQLSRPGDDGRPEYIRASIDGSLGGSAPITWISTSCTGWTRRCRWRRAGERWRRPWRRARRGTSACLRSRPTRSSGHRPCTRCRRSSPNCRCGPATRWPRSCRTTRSRASRSCRSRRSAAASWPAVLVLRRSAPGRLPARAPALPAGRAAANLAIVARVREIAERAGPARAGRAGLGLSQGRYVVPSRDQDPEIPGRQPGAADVELSPAHLADLDALPAPQGGRY